MRLLATLVLLAFAAAAEPAESDRHQIVAAVDLSWVHADSDLASWLESGNGKLRFDESHDGLRFARAFVDYRGRIAATLDANITLDSADDVSNRIDVTEAYLEWRPVPRGPWRLRSRAGAFYPRLSMENTDAGWSSPYALTSSLINTWIGEELRAMGAEIRLTRDFRRWPDQQLSVEGGVYYGNDPTGALLAWRGWSAHDRQTGLFGTLPTPVVSAIEPWDSSGAPLPDYDPFVEIDHRPGYYVAGEWQWQRRARIKAFHYDNHGDPEAVNSAGSYAWQTWFDHISVQVELPWRLALLGQWLSGSTRMGPDLGPWRVQDVDFDASFLLLTRAFGRHRVSARYEWFDLQPFNDPDGLTNQDDGNALALAYLFQPTSSVRIGAEYLNIASDRCRNDFCAWVGNGLPRTTREDSFQVTLRWRFDATF